MWGVFEYNCAAAAIVSQKSQNVSLLIIMYYYSLRQRTVISLSTVIIIKLQWTTKNQNTSIMYTQYTQVPCIHIHLLPTTTTMTRNEYLWVSTVKKHHRFFSSSFSVLSACERTTQVRIIHLYTRARRQTIYTTNSHIRAFGRARALAHTHP